MSGAQQPHVAGATIWKIWLEKKQRPQKIVIKAEMHVRNLTPVSLLTIGQLGKAL
jgi:hypothetical protein